MVSMGKACALVVEDDLEIAEVTRASLVDLGFMVHVSGGVEDALTYLAYSPADLVLSDIMRFRYLP